MSQSLLYNTSSGLVHMLRANQTENFTSPGSSSPAVDGLIGCGVIFNHLKEMGKSIVTDSENEANPAQFVEELFAYKEKYDAILVEAFGNNRLLGGSAISVSAS